ncbi:hypothetical protein Q8814_02445 [Rhodococcus sp. CC-R104]|uniref:Protein kinase n=2 Tax=Rhodococcus chondri TaxID=3065941 RepID=A0ABU7JM99_9NOCA|nr:hypothetical protein [Rhodococcus sp. CC-R104]
MTKVSGRVLGAGVVFVAAAGSALGVAGSAHAATTCSAPPGAEASIVQIQGSEGCGANTDTTGAAWSHGSGGVGFADAKDGSTVVAAGADGGVGAGESRGGQLAAVGFGAEALALGVLDNPATAVVVAGPQSQAYVGDVDDPILCEGDMASAVNFTTGRGCAVFGSWRYVSPAS